MLLWRGVAIVIGVATTILLARWLGPEDRGVLAIFVLTVSLVAVVLQAGAPEALVFVLGGGLFPKEEVVSTVVMFALGLVVLGAIIAQLLLVVWFGFDSVTSALLVTAAGGTILVTFLRHFLIAEKNFAKYSQSVVLEGVLYLGGIVIVSLIVGITVKLALLAYAMSLVVTLLSLGWSLLRDSGLKLSASRFRPEVVWTCLRYGFHLFVTGLGGFGVQRINYFMLEAFSGFRAVGLYAAANAVPSLFANLPQQLATVLYAYASSSENTALSTRLTVVVFQVLAGLCLSAIIPLVLFAERIVHLLFGPAYAGIGGSLVMLSFAMSFIGLGGVLFNALAGRGLHKFGSYLTFMNLVLISVLAYFFIPRWGLKGAVLAHLVTAFISLLFMVTVFCRISGLSFRNLIVIPRPMIRVILKRGWRADMKWVWFNLTR